MRRSAVVHELKGEVCPIGHDAVDPQVEQPGHRRCVVDGPHVHLDTGRVGCVDERDEVGLVAEARVHPEVVDGVVAVRRGREDRA